MPPSTIQSSSGSIRADELYTLPAVEKRLGFGVTAMRTARRNGLPVRYIGRKGFVAGKDLLEYFERHAKTYESR